MNKNTKIILANLGMVLATIIWGFAFVVVKNSVDAVGPIYLVALRFTLASLALGVIFFKRIKFNKEMLFQGVFLGALLFMGYSTQTIGAAHTTGGKNAFLTAVYVLIVPFFMWITHKKRPDVFAVVSAILGIIGVGIISLNGETGGINYGDILTLFCAVFYAVHMVYVEKYNKDRDAITTTFLQLSTVAVLGWISAPFFDGAFSVKVLMNSNTIIAVLYLGLLSTMLAYLLQNAAQKVVSASNASLVLSLESVFGAVFSAIFLPNESLSFKMVIGGAILMFSIVMAQTKFDFLKKK
jgi:drug/metabolite transporter (DMT)-like permease